MIWSAIWFLCGVICGMVATAFIVVAHESDRVGPSTTEGAVTYPRPIQCPSCRYIFEAPEPVFSALTKRQAELLGYLETYLSEHGYAPTFEEIASHFHFTSLATVHEHLMNLERKGYIARKYNESRALVILPKPEVTCQNPA